MKERKCYGIKKHNAPEEFPENRSEAVLKRADAAKSLFGILPDTMTLSKAKTERTEKI